MGRPLAQGSAETPGLGLPYTPRVPIRAVLASATVLAGLALLLLFGPVTVARVTDRPLVVDCGGIQLERCDRMWREDALQMRPGAETVTYVRLVGDEDCANATIEHSSFTFGLFGLTTERLCS